ncbi:MAG: hypothetical protein AB7R77_06000 [Ilumatobacteraceae bacterium]
MTTDDNCESPIFGVLDVAPDDDRLNKNGSLLDAPLPADALVVLT